MILRGSVLCRLIALSLFGLEMDDTALSAFLRLLKQAFNRPFIVAVNRTEIENTEIFKIITSIQGRLERLFDADQALDEPFSEQRNMTQNRRGNIFGFEIRAIAIDNLLL